jgi:hypothetical protein
VWGTGVISNARPARRGHAQPALKIGHVAKRDQLGTMFCGDYRWRVEYSGGTADRKQGGKFLDGELFSFHGHSSIVAHFGSPTMFNFAQLAALGIRLCPVDRRRF